MKKAEAVKQAEPIFSKMLLDPNRFKKLKNGWVRDSLLGLEWGPSSDKEKDWKDAQEHCKKLGGRLPEINELQSLVDYRNYSPAINKEVFHDTKSSWYWSGTTNAGYSDGAWVVTFGNGTVDDCYLGNVSYVRPVRSSQ